jgi:DNA helicase-2/ATP-dependent DNA helicase PcrA
MTLHGAKGLEFDCVFLTGWEEGLFPSQRTMDEHGIAGLEEERRLAYVGITRARQRAYISYAANRQMYGSWTSAIPSRFIDELPEVHVERESEIGAYGPGRSLHWDSSGFSPRPGLREPNVEVIQKNQSPVERGARVTHDKFGYGTVLQVDGKKLDIDFDEAGYKRVMAGFVRLF